MPSPSFVIGREEEVAEVGRQLDDAGVPLVTPRGAGGIGKTRLAIEVGRRSANSGHA